jgi:hypothetical protein
MYTRILYCRSGIQIHESMLSEFSLHLTVTSAFLQFPSSRLTGDIRGRAVSLENTSWLDLSTARVLLNI